ncbi:CBS domain-containing protein [Dethiosulfovibrio sp. F2B]|uniref:CBS domain-containing protein n=1 Tax=Dethiosulfovibrio faecalis TaxID=2720018 RepID=UPI001F2CE9D1|nr:CBS domain-containing protein [Dethiosulfovibrio faecalis]MCF4151418.1 CBS domain-containing protein [Dethiosulfovibrio faecalis]
MKVGELVDRDLTALSEDCPVSEAIEVLYHHNASGLPVLDEENRVIGFISEKDIIKAALPGYVHMLHDSSFLPDYGQFSSRLRDIADDPVSKYMKENVITFNEDDSDFYVANRVIKENIKIAPVLRDGQLVGIVSRSHLVRHLLLHPEEIEDALEDDPRK